MKLEDQVSSLKHSKRLEELGVKQDSLWWWIKQNNNTYKLSSPGMTKFFEEDCSAFTVAELGTMLPRGVTSGGYQLLDTTYNFGCWYELENGVTQSFGATTEADCRAKMLEWLIVNEHIKAGEL